MICSQAIRKDCTFAPLLGDIAPSGFKRIAAAVTEHDSENLFDLPGYHEPQPQPWRELATDLVRLKDIVGASSVGGHWPTAFSPLRAVRFFRILRTVTRLTLNVRAISYCEMRSASALTICSSFSSETVRGLGSGIYELIQYQSKLLLSSNTLKNVPLLTLTLALALAHAHKYYS